MNRKKVLIIGLDGFTWRIGERLIQEGHMPTLGRLVENGCHGKLKSVVPFETAPAWSSFQTGCYPEKTGIHAFHGYSRESRKIKLNSFQDIKVPTIWELLSDSGKKVISINMPITSPPPQVNGIIIPGLTCPYISRKTVYPPDIYDKFIKSYPNYRIVNKDKQETLRDDVKCSSETESERCSLAIELMKEIEWDLFSVQIQNTDAFQHRNWWALDPSAEGYTEDDYQLALEFYQHVDHALKKLVEAAGDSVLVVIASDHGFCSRKAEIGINTWLSQNGYLVLDSKKKSYSLKIAKEQLKSRFGILKLAARAYGNGIRHLKIFLEKTKHFYELHSEKVVQHIRETIDLDQSLAFCLGGMGGALYITDANRKDEATVMVEKLLHEYGPESPTPFIASIEPQKSSLENAAGLPDYMIHLMPGVEARIGPEDASVVKSGIINGKRTGTHEQDGVFLFHGPTVSPNTSFDAHIVDVAPTLLAYLSVPVPNHTDGHILSQAFGESLNIEYSTTGNFTKKSTTSSDDDQSTVEKQLKDLGYL